jgi:hypothetical protein
MVFDVAIGDFKAWYPAVFEVANCDLKELLSSAVS